MGDLGVRGRGLHLTMGDRAVRSRRWQFTIDDPGVRERHLHSANGDIVARGSGLGNAIPGPEDA